MGQFYRFGSRLFELGFKALAVDLRVSGHEHIPSAGPAILASNHIGYLDFVFVALAPPRPRREVRFLARSEFFDQPVIGFLLRRLRQIPVDVHGDPIAAVSVAREALAAGELIGLHPEGTISPSFVVRRAKSGAVRLAEATGAPIVPTAIWGSQRLMTKWRKIRPRRGVRVVVRYGEPFHPDAKTAMARTKQVMERIDELLAEIQKDYPPPEPGDDWWLPRHLGGSALSPEEAEERLREQDEIRRERRRSR